MRLNVKIIGLIFGLVVFQLTVCKTSPNTHDNQCRSDSKNTFCFCEKSRISYRKHKIVCENGTNPIQIKEALTVNWNYTLIPSLYLQNSNVHTLPANTFNKFRFERISFLRNNLNKIDKFLFQESSDTAKFVEFLRNNFQADFNLEFLQPLRKLRSVKFYGSNFFSIPDGAFGDLPNLEIITIHENNLLKLGKFAFDSLPRIDEINLARNNIEKLEDDMLRIHKRAGQISLVNFRGNQIKEIELNAFAGLKARHIDLRNNKLTTLNQTIFEPLLDSMVLFRYGELNTFGNPFKCDESMQWLIKKPPEYRARVKGCPCIENFDCGRPYPPPFSSVSFMSGTTYKSRVIYECYQFYTAVGNRESECQNNKTWSNPGLVCQAHCSISPLDYGYFVRQTVTNYARYNVIRTGKLFPHGTNLKFVCNEGYEIKSILFNDTDTELNTRCSNGHWLPFVQCTPIGCKCDDLDYDKLAESNLILAEDCMGMTLHDQEVLLKSNFQFSHPDQQKKLALKCNKGKWIIPQKHDEKSTTERSCFIQHLKLDNGKIYKDGKEWQLTDEKYIKALEQGSQLNLIEASHVETLKHGTELKFECLGKNYELHVDEYPVVNTRRAANYVVMNCNNGRWTGQMPTCKPARCSCSKLSLELLGTGLEIKDCEDLVSSGEFVFINCATNFSSSAGPVVAECEYGRWDITLVDCTNYP